MVFLWIHYHSCVPAQCACTRAVITPHGLGMRGKVSITSVTCQSSLRCLSLTWLLVRGLRDTSRAIANIFWALIWFLISFLSSCFIFTFATQSSEWQHFMQMITLPWIGFPTKGKSGQQRFPALFLLCWRYNRPERLPHKRCRPHNAW